MDDQLFTFLFAFILFGLGVVLMQITAAPGCKRVEEVCAEHDALSK